MEHMKKKMLRLKVDSINGPLQYNSRDPQKRCGRGRRLRSINLIFENWSERGNTIRLGGKACGRHPRGQILRPLARGRALRFFRSVMKVKVSSEEIALLAILNPNFKVAADCTVCAQEELCNREPSLRQSRSSVFEFDLEIVGEARRSRDQQRRTS